MQAFLFRIKKGKTKEVLEFYRENFSSVFSVNG